MPEDRINGHNLWHLLRDVIRASLKATPKEVAFGHPCSGLINDAVTMGLSKLTDLLLERGGEYRLNGAGLKMYISEKRVSIGGDQEKKYPDTVERLQALINERGMGRE